MSSSLSLNNQYWEIYCNTRQYKTMKNICFQILALCMSLHFPLKFAHWSVSDPQEQHKIFFSGLFPYRSLLEEVKRTIMSWLHSIQPEQLEFLELYLLWFDFCILSSSWSANILLYEHHTEMNIILVWVLLRIQSCPLFWKLIVPVILNKQTLWDNQNASFLFCFSTFQCPFKILQ